jgi:hypothetical protein
VAFEETVSRPFVARAARPRAWSQKRDREERARALDEAGFVADSEAVRLANAIVAACCPPGQARRRYSGDLHREQSGFQAITFFSPRWSHAAGAIHDSDFSIRLQ